MPRRKNSKNLPKSKDKKLYKIGQMAEVLNISPRSIRYFDQLGLFPHVKRSIGNTRLFDENDIEIIQKINKLKKEKHYPYEKIRDLLLKKTSISPQEIAIVCDNTENIDPQLKKNAHILQLLPQDDTEKKHIIWENIKENNRYPNTQSNDIDLTPIKEFLNNNKIKQCFVFLSSQHFHSWEKPLKTLNSSKHKMLIYNCEGFNSSSALLAQQLTERLLQNDTLEELELLVKKQRPMLFQIGYSLSCKTLLQNQKELSPLKVSPFIDQLLSFKAVFLRQKQHSNIICCVKNENDAQNKVMDEIAKELEKRGLYCHRVLITHANNEASAKKLLKTLQSLLRDTPIQIKEMTLTESLEIGPDSLLVSII